MPRVFVTLLAGLVLGSTANADPLTATLTLDVLSFISFDDETVVPIPSGSTLTFEFSDPNADGSVPFTIQPNGVSIPAVSSSALGATVQYELTGTASGTLTPTGGERIIQFQGEIAASDVAYPQLPARTYAMEFTTEDASTVNLQGTVSVSVEGYRPPDSADYVQLVGATVNKSDNEHGAAVTMVLSGLFDQLP